MDVFPLCSVAASDREGGAVAPSSSERASPNGSPGGGGSRPEWRYVLALCTVAIFICYADRSNISVAILPMAADFGWSEDTKGIVLSAFFGGYAATQLLGGTLADRHGGKAVLAVGVVLWSLFTFLTPDAAEQGIGVLLACRVAMGLGEGIAFPAVHSIISLTVPRAAQSTSVAIVTAASYGGAAAAAAAAPSIISATSWPMVFYIFGASALLWLPVWALADVPKGGLGGPVEPSAPGAPADAPRDGGGAKASGAVDEEAGALRTLDGVDAAPLASGSDEVRETAALLRHRPAAAVSVEDGEAPSLAPRGAQAAATKGGLAAQLGLDAGFVALLRRREVWAICVAQYCQSWGMYALLNWLPTFFAEQYSVDIGDLGPYTLVPPLVQAVVGGFSGALADRLIARGVPIRRTRQLLQVAGMLGPAVCLLAAVSPALQARPAAASALVTAAQGFSALTLGAVSVSQLDIAPRHAGAIFGLGNTTATAAGLLSTRLTGTVLEATGSWALVFGLTAAHYVAGAAVWYAWVGAERLPEDELG